MNKFYFALFVCSYYLFVPLYAKLDLSIEFRTSAFISSSNLMSKIYGRVHPEYSIQMKTHLSECIETWVIYDYHSGHGKGIGKCCKKTNLDVNMIGLGLSYNCPLCCSTELYGGIGASLSRVYVQNETCCSKHKETKLPVGVLFKSGILYCFYSNFYLDLFVDYLYEPVKFRHRSVDVGGVDVGLGIGYKF